ncbi:MAG: hypothetical protein ABJN95_15120 [Maribacter sp.]
MENSSIIHINQSDTSFGRLNLSVEGGFEGSNPKIHFSFFQNRISTRNF